MVLHATIELLKATCYSYKECIFFPPTNVMSDSLLFLKMWAAYYCKAPHTHSILLVESININTYLSIYQQIINSSVMLWTPILLHVYGRWGCKTYAVVLLLPTLVWALIRIGCGSLIPFHYKRPKQWHYYSQGNNANNEVIKLHQ